MQVGEGHACMQVWEVNFFGGKGGAAGTACIQDCCLRPHGLPCSRVPHHVTCQMRVPRRASSSCVSYSPRPHARTTLPAVMEKAPCALSERKYAVRPKPLP